jgi:hypothetical protein
MSVFETFAKTLPHPPEFVGTCLDCGTRVYDPTFGPFRCDCHDIPPAEFDIDQPPTRDELP